MYAHFLIGSRFCSAQPLVQNDHDQPFYAKRLFPNDMTAFPFPRTLPTFRTQMEIEREAYSRSGHPPFSLLNAAPLGLGRHISTGDDGSSSYGMPQVPTSDPWGIRFPPHLHPEINRRLIGLITNTADLLTAPYG